MENMKKRSAFSLAELLITLIIVSCILAAFAPVITKRMANGGVSIGGSSGPAQQVEANVTIDGLTDVCDNPDCKLCIANACLICGIECPPPLSRDYKNCRCVDCSPFDAHCAECNSTQCKKCATGYRMVNNHCESCENLPDGQYCDGTGQVQTCPKGSYCINGVATLCPDNTYTNKTGQSDCTTCPAGKYSAAGATDCIACSSAYGSYCTECNVKSCTMCKDGYVVSGKQCIEENANIVGYNGLYIYKYNAGDEGGPEIPSTVKVVNAGTSCSGDCCWRATTTVNTAKDGCTSTGNGSSTYSGCKRTVCSYGAAQKICQNIGWRLPTYSEATQWYKISAGLGKAGLQLCDSSSGNYKNVYCPTINRCNGSGDNYCYTYNVWTDAGYYTHLSNGKISYGSGWSPYTGSVRCVKDDYSIPEGCKVANSDGNCRECESGYILNEGQCEYGLEKGLAMRYNGFYITKYNAGDKNGVSIPNTVMVMDAGSSCSGKCCWRAGTNLTSASTCTSSYGLGSDYSGCDRTVCNYSAATEICGKAPGGGWRLPTQKEALTFLYATSGLGNKGIQLCDASSGDYKNVRCSAHTTGCWGSGDNYCYPYNVWTDTGYYIHLSNGKMSQGGSWTPYTGSVRCIKVDPNFPEGCLIAHDTIEDRCLQCKPGYKLSSGKCTYNLEKSYSMRYNGYFINKYNAGDEGGVPIPSTVTVVDSTASCSGKCCWKAGVNNTSKDGCTSSGNGDSKYSGCNRTICTYSAAVEICAQAPGGNWRLPTYLEANRFVMVSAGMGQAGLQLCDSSSANYKNVYCPAHTTGCWGSGDNYCYPYNVWADSGYYTHLSNGKTSYGSGWSAYTGGVRCIKEDPNFPAGCLIADENVTNKCLTCKQGYTLKNGVCTYDLETDEKSLRYNGLIIAKYNAGDEKGLPIPDTVTITSDGASCSGKCCWRSVNQNTAADTCTSTYGSGSDYSGCNRTICTYSAAVEICAKAPGGNWRLPTYADTIRWSEASSGLGSNGLQLCDSSSGNYRNVYCPAHTTRCWGTGDNYCYPYNVWADSGYYTHLSNGKINYGSGWSPYTGGVRCIKDDVNAIEGCLFANDQGQCTQCKSGYTMNNGTCEYSLAYLEYNGLKITKYNAGDLLGPPIPNTVLIADAGSSCSGKCCWRAGVNKTSSDSCTSSYGSGTDYSGCTRTVCTWSAASEICGNIPDGGWRLPMPAELEIIKGAIGTINTNKGKDGLQLCDSSSNAAGTTYCPTASGKCPGSGDGHCYPFNVWGESGYYMHLSKGNISYGGNWASYTGSVRCVK